MSPYPSSPLPLSSAPDRGEEHTTEAFIHTLARLQQEGLGLAQDHGNQASSSSSSSSSSSTVGDSGFQDVAIDVGMDAEGRNGLSSLSPELRKELEQYRSTQRHAHLMDHYPHNQHAQEPMRQLLQAINNCIAKEKKSTKKAAKKATNTTTHPIAPAATADNNDTWGMAEWFAATSQVKK